MSVGVWRMRVGMCSFYNSFYRLSLDGCAFLTVTGGGGWGRVGVCILTSFHTPPLGACVALTVTSSVSSPCPPAVSSGS